jgi:hypothetical protein
MKKLLLLAALMVLGTGGRLGATQIVFYSEFSFATPSPVNPFSLELGTFNSGFTPTSANLDDWLSNWNSDSTGYVDTAAPEWQASLVFGNNSFFPVGAQLYLWAYDVRTPAGAGQWALFTEFTAPWMVPVADPLALDPVQLSFSNDTVAILGELEFARSGASTAAAVAISAVPEPSTYGGMSLALLLAAMAWRRSRR